MLFKSSFYILIFTSVLFILIHSKRLKREISNYEPRCLHQETAVDQVIPRSRKKRFVLFPEFSNYLNDQRYLHAPKEIFYWIANFYPKKIETDYVYRCIKDMIQQINTVIGQDIILTPANDPGEANFHFHFFDYTKCPMDDLPEASIDNVKALDPLLIYPVEVTRKSRYRANGGIHLIENDRPISTMKFNMQQTFLYSENFIYDPTLYTCNDDTNECLIDLYWALLHETLHGFGIEHTTNAEKPTPPNPQMQSVMHFSNFRTLCHDDIRAIRMVYKQPVKRENAIYDDTCRRDFPMNTLQKIMYRIRRMMYIGFFGYLILSLIIFILTLIYLLIRYLSKQKSSQIEKLPSIHSKITKDEKPVINIKRNNKPHGYLWHNDMI